MAITGPESTGKSTLSNQLAKYYQTVSTDEYARSFLDSLERPYEKKDLLEIANGQIREENSKQLAANRLLFCDTDLLVIKIWSEYKYGSLDPKILSEIGKRNYDIYLLTNIDLPWKYDIQREHPDKRAYFFNLFQKELKSIHANYHIIQGENDQRLKSAVKVIDAFTSQLQDEQ